MSNGEPRPMLHGILRESAAPSDWLADGRAEGLPEGLRAVAGSGLLAVVADLDPAAVRGADTPRLQAYADLVARLHRTAPLVPMRFGCMLADDAAIRTLLAEHRERLLEMLAQVEGCDEFGLRLLVPAGRGGPATAAAAPAPDASVTPTPDPNQDPEAEADSGPAPASDPGPGHRHLAAIRRRLSGEAADAATAAAARAAIETVVAGHYRACREEFGQFGAQPMLSLYFLVPRGQHASFIAALRSLGQGGDGASAAVPWDFGTGLLTGPWPPYNFVGAIDGQLRSVV